MNFAFISHGLIMPLRKRSADYWWSVKTIRWDVIGRDNLKISLWVVSLAIHSDLTHCTISLLQDQHLSTCQFITVECRGCGDSVLLSELDEHLKNKCLQRLVECEDCGKQMQFRDLEVSNNIAITALMHQCDQQSFKLITIFRLCLWNNLSFHRDMVIAVLLQKEHVTSASWKCQHTRYCLI